MAVQTWFCVPFRAWGRTLGSLPLWFQGVTVSPKSEEFKFFRSSPTRLCLISGNGSILQAGAENCPDRQTHSQHSGAVAERWRILLFTPHPPQEQGVSQSKGPGITQLLCWFKINMFSLYIHFWLWNPQFQQIHIIFYCLDIPQQPKKSPLPHPCQRSNVGLVSLLAGVWVGTGTFILVPTGVCAFVFCWRRTEPVEDSVLLHGYKIWGWHGRAEQLFCLSWGSLGRPPEYTKAIRVHDSELETQLYS